MNHNIFCFDLTCKTFNNNPVQYILIDYFSDQADLINDHGAQASNFEIEQTGLGEFEVIFMLQVHDYGVSQVGVHLLGAYLRKVYEGVLSGETGFEIQRCDVIHSSGRGASIGWDAIKNEPIINDLELE